MNIFNNTLTKDLYFMTDTVVDWVDIFTRPTYNGVITILSRAQRINNLCLGIDE
jgi:hypothetical protein